MYGTGGVRQRGRIWYYYYNLHGRQVQRSAYSEKKSDAVRLLKTAIEDVRNYRAGTVPPDRITVNELLTDLVETYRREGKPSLAWCRLVVEKHLRPFFKYHRAARLATKDIEVYIDARQSLGIANGTINRELALLRRALRLGMEQQPPKVKDAIRIPKLEESPAREGFFEYGDFLRLRENLPDELKGPVTFAYFTGCRRTEIFTLKWKQVDFESGMVQWTRTKNKRPRVVPLTGELMRIMQCLKAERDENWPRSPWVFSRCGERIKDFRAAWKAACLAAGIEGKLFHDFRRTGVRNLVRAGAPEKVAMEISGHRTRSTFERYNITAGDDLRSAVERVQRHIEKGGADERT